MMRSPGSLNMILLSIRFIAVIVLPVSTLSNMQTGGRQDDFF